MASRPMDTIEAPIDSQNGRNAIRQKIPGSDRQQLIAAGAVSLALIGGLLALRGSRRKNRSKSVRARAEQLLPKDLSERVTHSLDDGSWKKWVAGGLAVLAARRASESRRLRRLAKAIVETS